METKLIKVLEHYHLYVGDKAIATTIVGNPMLLPNLSLKNCEEVERGYDLDTEVENIVKTIVPDDRGKDIWYGTSMAVGKQCFKKALEILGDKKFSEEDMKKAIYIAWEGGDLASTHIIESLQQTEFDVEIVMGDPIGIGDKYTPDTKPKLDADGCLILKRKQLGLMMLISYNI